MRCHTGVCESARVKEHDSWKLVLCFHHGSPGDQSQVFRLGGKHCDPCAILSEDYLSTLRAEMASSPYLVSVHHLVLLPGGAGPKKAERGRERGQRSEPAY